MALSIALTIVALLLAVPVGFVAFLLAFRAVGPWRTLPREYVLPDLADEHQRWDRRDRRGARQPAVAVPPTGPAGRGSRVRPAERGAWPLDCLPNPADTRSAA